MIKKVLPWLVILIFSTLLIIGFAMKDNINNYLSELMKQQASPDISSSGEALVNSLYNYSENGQNYEFTLLEFGSVGCSACKRMEKVLDEISDTYPSRVNVVFYNVMKPESQDLIKLYGIAAIPIQIVLDKNGKEIFKHYGYISFEELIKQF